MMQSSFHRRIVCRESKVRCDILGWAIEYPIAIGILGGLATSTLLNLLVVPILYLRFGRDPRSVVPQATWLNAKTA